MTKSWTESTPYERRLRFVLPPVGASPLPPEEQTALKKIVTCQNYCNLLLQFAEKNKCAYLKIKLLELLFVLSQVDTSQLRYEEYSVARTQAELVKKVAAYISDNLNDALNLKKLTNQFGISAICKSLFID